MATADPAKEATTAFVKAQFRRYYESTKPQLPDRFAKREFGFMFWTPGIVQRHLGFARPEELRSFLTGRVPAHAYYSSAYYENPNAPTMEEKGWLGADLIFDLDADHLPNAVKMSYPEMLEAIRLKILHLYDDFLTADFGFDEKAMRLVFSGGRGYHIHVFDGRVWGLGSHERREIVDWITGKGLDVANVFKESVFDSRDFQGHRYSKKRIIMADPKTAKGWPGKIARGFQKLAVKLEPLEKAEAVEFLRSFEGIGAKDADGLWRNLFENRASGPEVVRGIDRFLQTGQIETLSDPNVRLVISIINQMETVRLEERAGLALDDVNPFGSTDEPVSSDIKRLIRMPSSLHGKTGLQVVPLTRNELDEFRPLRDAVPTAWTDDRVRVRLKNKVSVTLRDEPVDLAPGDHDVPEYVAVFLAARGQATVAAGG